jgi:hypothetical protein
VIGGLIGIAGGFFGPLFLQKQREVIEKKKQRAEKFQELMAALFEYEHWLDMLRDTLLFTTEINIVPTPSASPFAKLHAVSAIYFPDLESKIAVLEKAGKKREIWLGKARHKKIEATISRPPNNATFFRKLVSWFRKLAASAPENA